MCTKQNELCKSLFGQEGRNRQHVAKLVYIREIKKMELSRKTICPENPRLVGQNISWSLFIFNVVKFCYISVFFLTVVSKVWNRLLPYAVVFHLGDRPTTLGIKARFLFCDEKPVSIVSPLPTNEKYPKTIQHFCGTKLLAIFILSLIIPFINDIS